MLVVIHSWNFLLSLQNGGETCFKIKKALYPQILFIYILLQFLEQTAVTYWNNIKIVAFVNEEHVFSMRYKLILNVI